ncbi:sodium-dependent dicarboxylate transporter 2/3/5 [Tamaricihabitans halophyticus]|uniref:Sodium-dependent dicarboxylate transporter SdcS n=1 Tax=Tamaricihabitans halophyticus TaxID=1262583 RepID=A0A4R2R0S4_9PSEU|nr:DASS family sodium-coupled anion symporter [Tamaricihabitans halophyticus]TCP55058.1 sodium-dependent dicarboxylate transporter 2/3/5 [Tamaricihabitans halophyticus]
MTQVGDKTTESESATGSSRLNWVGLLLGPCLAALLYLVLPDSLAGNGKIAAAVAMLMATWWVTEAIPLPATALLPMIMFPVLGVAPIEDVVGPYADKVIFLFMGGFVLGLAMQRWNLHRRFALRTVLLVGTSPVRLIGGFMLATGFITMWVSNTATAVIMYPVGLSVLALVGQLGDGKGDKNFSTALMLGIAYAASIGSLGTIIGTPPNTFLVGYLRDNHDINIGFGQWMLFGVPISAVFLVLAWLVLSKFVYRPRIKELPGSRELLKQQLDEMGPMSRGEKNALGVFIGAAAAWILAPLLADPTIMGGAALTWLDRLDDSVIAMAVAVVLFILPAGGGARTIDWDTTKQLPWGVLLLFGGGLSLSGQFTESGLSSWLGEQVRGLDVLPTVLFVAAAALIVLALTELTSNTATAATFIPILGGVAVGLGIDPMALVVPAALAATCAFMLPVATPPNAIVFGSGHVTIGQMVRGGVWLNVIAVVLITVAVYALGGWILGIAL